MEEGQARSKFLFFALLAGVAVFGCFQIVQATRWGLWAHSDSAVYYAAARNFMQGKGLTISLAGGGFDTYEQFPPLYPILIGVSGKLMGNYFEAARWINILAYGVFLYLSGVLVYSITQQVWTSLLAPITFLVSPMLITNFTGAMTEGVFFALMMLAWLCALHTLRFPKVSNLTALILVSSLLPITRYFGLSVIFANFLMLAFFFPAPLKKRLLTAARVSLLSLIPLLLWSVYLFFTTRLVGGRQIGVFAAFFKHARDALSQMTLVFQKFLPYYGRFENVLSSNTRLALMIMVVSCLFLLCVLLLLKSAQKGAEGRIRIAEYGSAFLYLLIFTGFIWFSYSITNASFRIDDRQLSPLIPMLVIFSLLSVAALTPEGKQARLVSNLLLLLIFGFVFRYYVFTSRTLIRRLGEDGRGNSSRHYQQSGIIDALKTIPPERLIISNSSSFILMYDNRLPLQVEQFHGHAFGSGNSPGEREFREKNAALVLLFPDFYTDYGAGALELLAKVTQGLTIAYQDAVSAIYYYPQ